MKDVHRRRTSCGTPRNNSLTSQANHENLSRRRHHDRLYHQRRAHPVGTPCLSRPSRSCKSSSMHSDSPGRLSVDAACTRSQGSNTTHTHTRGVHSVPGRSCITSASIDFQTTRHVDGRFFGYGMVLFGFGMTKISYGSMYQKHCVTRRWDGGRRALLHASTVDGQSCSCHHTYWHFGHFFLRRIPLFTVVFASSVSAWMGLGSGMALLVTKAS